MDRARPAQAEVRDARDWIGNGKDIGARPDRPVPSALTSLPQTRRLPLYTATSLILIACLASALLLYPAKVFHTARTWTLDPCLSSGDKKSSLLDRRFLAHIEGMRQKWDIAGMVVTMVASPKYTGAGWEQDIWGFGEASADGVEVTPETMWGIASNSKLFTALAVALLIDRKSPTPHSNGTVLSFHTKVKDVLPWWGVQDPYAEEHLTILDMLSMRSGIPSHDFYHGHIPPRQGLLGLKHLRPSAEIRETWQYNNQHYFTLAEIVRTVSGVLFTDFVQTEIFDPLNMTQTTYNSTFAKETGHRAEAVLHHGMDWEACKTYKPQDGRVPKGCLGKKAAFGWWTTTDAVTEAGAGSMAISGNDMAKWIRELLEPQHLPAALVERCAEPLAIMSSAFTIPLPDTGDKPSQSVWTYGMAQMRATYRGQTIIMHTGGLPGSYSVLLRLPDMGVGMMIATNDDFGGPPFFRSVLLSIVDHLLGLHGQHAPKWDDVFMPSLWRRGDWTQPPVDPDPPRPSQLSRYHNAAYGSLDFTRADPSTDKDTLAALRELLQPLKVDTDTHIAHVDKAFLNTLAFTHFDGQLWNWTTLIMYDTPAGRLASRTQASGSAIVTDDGIGMFGNYWIAGDVPLRHAEKGSVREDAEVWYECM